jgi:hypothetical protein
MTGTNLREFENLVVLTVAWLVEEVYSLAICEELATHFGRSVKLNVVHLYSSASKKRDM